MPSLTNPQPCVISQVNYIKPCHKFLCVIGGHLTCHYIPCRHVAEGEALPKNSELLAGVALSVEGRRLADDFSNVKEKYRSSWRG